MPPRGNTVSPRAHGRIVPQRAASRRLSGHRSDGRASGPGARPERDAGCSSLRFLGGSGICRKTGRPRQKTDVDLRRGNLTGRGIRPASGELGSGKGGRTNVTTPATATTTSTTNKDARPRQGRCPAPNRRLLRRQVGTERGRNRNILKTGPGVRRDEGRARSSGKVLGLEDAFPFELAASLQGAEHRRALRSRVYGWAAGRAWALLGLHSDGARAQFDPVDLDVHRRSTPGLAMGSIYLGGSEEQKEEVAAADGHASKRSAASGLTEPLVGFGNLRRAMTNDGRRREGEYLGSLNGEEEMDRQTRPWCDISIIWARRRRPITRSRASSSRTRRRPAFSVEKITDKMALEGGPERPHHDEGLPACPEANRLPARRVISRHGRARC